MHDVWPSNDTLWRMRKVRYAAQQQSIARYPSVGALGHIMTRCVRSMLPGTYSEWRLDCWLQLKIPDYKQWLPTNYKGPHCSKYEPLIVPVEGPRLWTTRLKVANSTLCPLTDGGYIGRIGQRTQDGRVSIRAEALMKIERARGNVRNRDSNGDFQQPRTVSHQSCNKLTRWRTFTSTRASANVTQGVSRHGL